MINLCMYNMKNMLIITYTRTPAENYYCICKTTENTSESCYAEINVCIKAKLDNENLLNKEKLNVHIFALDK